MGGVPESGGIRYAIYIQKSSGYKLRHRYSKCPQYNSDGETFPQRVTAREWHVDPWKRDEKPNGEYGSSSPASLAIARPRSFFFT